MSSVPAGHGERIAYVPRRSTFALTAVSGLICLCLTEGGIGGEKPLRLALLEFQSADASQASQRLSHLCESALFERLGRMEGIELVERAHIEHIIAEHTLNRGGLGADPLLLGELLGTDLLLFGRSSKTLVATHAEVLVLEVASGNVLLSASHELEEPLDASIRTLAAAVERMLPAALATREKDRSMPSATVLNVRNTSRLQRLNHLEPIIQGLLEQTIAGIGKYRLLRRQHPGLARAETELSYAGWVKASDAVVAARADVVISCEFQERYQAGLSFEETPLEMIARIARRNGETTETRVAGKAGDLPRLLGSLRRGVESQLTGGESHPGSHADDKLLEALNLFREAVGDAVWQELGNAEVARPPGSFDPMFLQRFSEQIHGADSSVLSERDNFQRRAELLERALYLDPGLSIARFYLGICLDRLSTKLPAVERVRQLERSAREFELFLGSNPRGALREYTYRNLIWCLFYISNLPSPPDKPKEYPLSRLKRGVELLIAYMLEEPKKFMPDQQYTLGHIYFRQTDDKALIQWHLFVERIYGAEHATYNVGCPFLDAAESLLALNRPQEAMEYYQRAMKEHNHDGAARGSSHVASAILASIESALGKEKITAPQTPGNENTGVGTIRGRTIAIACVVRS